MSRAECAAVALVGIDSLFQQIVKVSNGLFSVGTVNYNRLQYNIYFTIEFFTFLTLSL